MGKPFRFFGYSISIQDKYSSYDIMNTEVDLDRPFDILMDENRIIVNGDV